MNSTDFKDKKALIIGFGTTGVSAASYLLKHGAEVFVYDDKGEEDIDLENLNKFKDSEKFTGFFNKEISQDVIDSIDFVVASPGLHDDHKVLMQVKGKEIFNDITLFLDVFNKKGKVVGVTGSNGKSTIVTLLHEALKADGQNVYLGGNIGLSPLDFVDEIEGDDSIIILEVSSYQLENFKEDHYFDICLITNISDNHLDRYHGDMQLYADAKTKGINNKNTKVILNVDDQNTIKYIFKKINKDNMVEVTFSDDDQMELFQEYKDRKLIGMHNMYNIALSLKVIESLGIVISEKLKRAILDFKGLEHRIEFVREVDGVRYVNDSKSTTVDSTVKALEAVTEDKNVVFITGGDDKGFSYAPLKDYFIKYVKSVILLPGSANEKITKVLKDSKIKEIKEVKEMSEAVEIAEGFSNEGDTVLLSPATASFASFEDFEDRGNQFKQAVNKLPSLLTPKA